MEIFRKAKSVIVREHLEDGDYVFTAIFLEKENILIAMDNGTILDPSWDWIEIVREVFWVNVSKEMGGSYLD